MNLTKKRWIILMVSCLINLCIGSLYAWSVFANPMAEHISSIGKISLTPGSLAIVFTVANSVGPITMISGGKINEKLGSNVVVFLGGIMFGGGMFLSSFAQNVVHLVITYGLFVGLGMGLVYGCTITNSVKFFPDKRGLIGGMTTASYGLSSFIIPPIANKVIVGLGVTQAFKILGIVFILVICTGSFFIEKCPDGFMPDGFKIKLNKTNNYMFRDEDWTVMVSSPIFYIMISMLIFGAFSGLMCISQVSTIAQEMIGMSVSSATMAVSILALFNAFGRVIAGYISDKIGRINAVTSAFIISIIGLLLLIISKEGSVLSFYIAISLIGLSFGSFMGVYPGFTADQFGSKYNSVNYGIMFIGFAIAGCFGPISMMNIYLITNSYKVAFGMAILLSILGILFTFIYRKMKKENQNILLQYKV